MVTICESKQAANIARAKGNGHYESARMRRHNEAFLEVAPLVDMRPNGADVHISAPGSNPQLELCLMYSALDHASLGLYIPQLVHGNDGDEFALLEGLNDEALIPSDLDAMLSALNRTDSIDAEDRAGYRVAVETLEAFVEQFTQK